MWNRGGKKITGQYYAKKKNIANFHPFEIHTQEHDATRSLHRKSLFFLTPEEEMKLNISTCTIVRGEKRTSNFFEFEAAPVCATEKMQESKQRLRVPPPKTADTNARDCTGKTRLG